MGDLACPCCGTTVKDIPVEGLRHVPLAGHSKAIVEALVRAYPRPVGMAYLVDAVYGDDPNGGPDLPGRTISQYLVQLRHKLPEYGWTIPNASVGAGSRTAGYRLLRL